ncbi:excinuclease ABC subunit UvrC [Rickettsiales endosymbiont of Stachyamoeba lipophora]|uniref:excinuclease ABC subunit UvrC n=1 Tax=Rickettsiales endosymbiont of Stachyamoeba lipophora TaxID=2486578 RepID=UPI000F6553D0|nr:excinuclease ABC subunit UvrC [Rickettsiales endosymbiont of Stachyamoeba lipophora]AZL16042.1 excinuclease ABC subunit UvrC [Rickettsiales endosymbiont of Stachyamoeba lipophora]
MSKLKSFDFVKEFIKNLPSTPGVYRMISDENKVLYVGKAKNLKARVSNYATPARLNNRIIRMIEQIVDIQVIITKSEAEALLLEASLIKTLKPRYNILLRDDKSFPYIHIRTDHEFPQITKYRGKKQNDGFYYGPFASARDVNNSINEIQKIFLLRPCSDSFLASRKRPCLEYQIKRCSAPCVNNISSSEYADLVASANSFLQGKSKNLLDDLKHKMHIASIETKYEQAAWYRDRIKALEKVIARHHVNLSGSSDVDVIALYRDEGLVCIQIFFFRGGQNYGNRSYFPAHTEDTENSEILNAFIGLFYQDRIAPTEIWLNQEAEEAGELENLLGQIAGYKVKISVPKRGEKKQIVELALNNAHNSLAQKLKETAKFAKLFAQVAEIFKLDQETNHLYHSKLKEESLEETKISTREYLNVFDNEHIHPPTTNLPPRKDYTGQIFRIEVFDNSHISGTNAVGAMIVVGQDGFNKNEYKKFNIKTVMDKGGDDYAMLYEVLNRRLTRLIKNHPEYEAGTWPDFWLIDGGKGQQTIVEKVFHELGIRIPYACIAKGEDRNSGRETFFTPHLAPFSLDRNDSVMKYLQIIRDEAHRFAITSHRNLRSSKIKISMLDQIDGIGPKRKQALFKEFGSIEGVLEADTEAVSKVLKLNIQTSTEIIHNIKNLLESKKTPSE